MKTIKVQMIMSEEFFELLEMDFVMDSLAAIEADAVSEVTFALTVLMGAIKKGECSLEKGKFLCSAKRIDE